MYILSVFYEKFLIIAVWCKALRKIVNVFDLTRFSDIRKTYVWKLEVVL